MMTRTIYLASPFFTEEQRAWLDKLEPAVKKIAARMDENVTHIKHDMFSPRHRTYVPPDADHDDRWHAFHKNLVAIRDAVLVIARIDDFDPGTIFEMGAAWAYGIPIIAYTTLEKGRGLNLMLAEACDSFARGFTELLIMIEHKSRWRKWKGEIV